MTYVHVKVSLPVDVVERVDGLAAAQDRSRSWVVRALVLRGLGVDSSGVVKLPEKSEKPREESGSRVPTAPVTDPPEACAHRRVKKFSWGKLCEDCQEKL